MKYVKELDVRHSKELRCSLVQGQDDKHYMIYTIQLYPFLLDDGRANFDTVVVETDENGDYTVLRQQYNKRYHTREEALKHHETILQTFDTLLRIPVSKKKEAAPAAAPAAGTATPAAPAAPEKK